MDDYFEIDFLDVEADKSGDAITIHYAKNGKINIHVVDGGFQATGDKIVEHIKQYYKNPKKIDRVVVTHQDSDHTIGLRTVLETFEIDELWMLRPWLYAKELIDRFQRYQNPENLAKRLKEIYPNLVALEEIAIAKNIKILEPFQGSKIGEFTVMAPSKNRYFELILESEKTPDQKKPNILTDKLNYVCESVKNVIWGIESFPEEGTSAENEMSIVQYSELNGKKILLTGDVGRNGLMEAADYADKIGIKLPGINIFQVPHHGSRHNISIETLNRWLGKNLSEEEIARNGNKFSAFISSAKADKKHPRKSVIRAFIHRGAKVLATEGSNICTFQNAPKREGWNSVEGLPYPYDEDDNS
jgi:beta-lactamase superfamily II metal-dependent hydrolase